MPHRWLQRVLLGGDTVKSSAGEGTVVEIKADGTAVVDIGGETHELAKGAYEKLGNAV